MKYGIKAVYKIYKDKIIYIILAYMNCFLINALKYLPWYGSPSINQLIKGLLYADDTWSEFDTSDETYI